MAQPWERAALAQPWDASIGGDHGIVHPGRRWCRRGCSATTPAPRPSARDPRRHGRRSAAGWSDSDRGRRRRPDANGPRGPAGATGRPGGARGVPGRQGPSTDVEGEAGDKGYLAGDDGDVVPEAGLLEGVEREREAGARRQSSAAPRRRITGHGRRGPKLPRGLRTDADPRRPTPATDPLLAPVPTHGSPARGADRPPSIRRPGVAPREPGNWWPRTAWAARDATTPVSRGAGRRPRVGGDRATGSPPDRAAGGPPGRIRPTPGSSRGFTPRAGKGGSRESGSGCGTVLTALSSTGYPPSPRGVLTPARSASLRTVVRDVSRETGEGGRTVRRCPPRCPQVFHPLACRAPVLLDRGRSFCRRYR